MAHERIVEDWRNAQEGAKKRLNLVVVGHVDAGKSTLMGRLLHSLGGLSDKEHTSNERASAKLGKGSFAYAWALDSSEEERSRGVTIDVAQDHFSTPNRLFTLLDAPGHRDFIPNMISGAAQADSALLVVDASLGAFEAGFGPNGQTREHALLVRSLGVQQLVVVVNKMDVVDYDQQRYRHIESTIRPFLTTSGFDNGKVSVVPCGAFVGENIDVRDANGKLAAWYKGQTLIDVLDTLEAPQRRLDVPLRMPITNVFRAGQTAISSGIGVSGRLISGVLSVGDRLSVVPGDESGIVKAIEHDGESVPWAVAGSSVTVFLSQIEINFITIGAVLCPPTSPVHTSISFVAQLLVFEPSLPILAGTTLDLHHHSSNVSATVSELIATLDMKTGATIRNKPRVLSKGITAKVRITLNAPLAIDTFANSRDLGRILLRMNGETVAAGIVLDVN
jgi:elongation factor 1 alpha-like protein